MGSGRGDDAEADYDAFFDDCLPMVTNLAGRLTGSAAEGEDVAIEALGRAYAHWSKLRLAPYRRAWVLRVATNLVIGRARRRHPSASPPDAAKDEADMIVLRTALIAALAALPRRQREAVALRYLVDLSEAETAQAMGITAGSVKTHLSRGLDALRVHLGEDVGAGGLLHVR